MSQPRQSVDQLGLSVAVDSRDADDLARTHVERDAAHRLEPAVVAHDEILDLQQGLPRRRLLLLDPQQHLRPTIERASPASVAPSRSIVSIRFPRRSTVIRSEISSTSFSLWLMKMIDFPGDLRLSMISKSSFASCGVSTAVGSSRIRISAPR